MRRQGDGFERARFGERLHHRCADTGEFRQLGGLQRQAFAGDVEHPGALVGEFLGLARSDAISNLRLRFTEGAGRPKAEPQHIAERLDIIICHPVDESAMRAGERRHIEFLDDRAQGLAAAIARPQPPDTTNVGARSKRHFHIVAGLDHETLRYGIAIGPGKCQRQQHIGEIEGIGRHCRSLAPTADDGQAHGRKPAQ